MQPVLQQLGRGVVRLWMCLGGRMTQKIVQVFETVHNVMSGCWP